MVNPARPAFRSTIRIGSPLPVHERLELPLPRVGWVTIAGDPIPEDRTLEEFVTAHTGLLARTVPGFRETRRATSALLGLSEACLIEFEAHPEAGPATTHIHCCGVHGSRAYVVGATLPGEGHADTGPVLAALMRTITIGDETPRGPAESPPA
jgi:hypothetical protein